VRALLTDQVKRGEPCRECGRKVQASKITSHGKSDSPEWRCWRSMRARCTDPKNQQFPNYGARGIKVCERWANSFENFLADMGERPSPKHSLDRFPNNDGDYEPGNCRWATQTEQIRNRRNTLHVTIGGITRTTGEWAEIAGISSRLIVGRFLHGCAPDRLLRPKRRGVVQTPKVAAQVARMAALAGNEGERTDG
jgi:hypothetical protein